MPFSTSQHMDGVLGGAQIGYNVQFNRTWLAGLEADFQGTEITINSKWTLSPDGKVLTDAWHLVTPQGEFDMTYVLNKK